MPPRRKLTTRQAAVKAGWRSGLEETIAKLLGREGIEFEYETIKIPFLQPSKPRTYTPDFVLPNGIVIETKGRFLTADRQKHKLVKAQHPDLDLRFVFSNSRTRISKVSPTSYAKWCDDHGFPHADKEPPRSWLTEPPNKRSLAAIARLRTSSRKPSSS